MYVTLCKPLLDRLFALLALLVLSPLLVLIALLLVVFQKGVVLFTQQRIGRHEEPFTLIKFCTMAPGNQPAAVRVTAIGRLLRRTSLDELPQLINILKGDMSFIGPRPLLPEYLPLYNADQRKRHKVKPGIAGLAQVKGRSSISWTQKFEYDLDYVKRISFALDCFILLRTVVLLFSFKPDVSLYEEPFRGNNL